MPYSTQELEAFVKELGLPEDKAKMVREAIGSDGAALTKFGEHVLRQSDYSAKLDELAKERTRLEEDYQAKAEKETKFHAGVAQWKSDAEQKMADDLAKATADAEARVNAAREKVKALVARGAVLEDDVKDLLTPTTTTVVTRTVDQPREKDGKWMTVEQFQKESEFYAKLPGMQLTMDREYYRLFGNDAPPINWDAVIESAKKLTTSKQPLRDAFDQTYKVPEKRAELAKKQHDDEIAAAEKRGAESARSKLLADNPDLAGRTVTRERPGSPILERGRAQEEELRKTGKLPVRDHAARDTVSAAVAAFNDGKYKGGTEHAA